RDIADHRQRLGIQAANVRIVAGGNRRDSGFQIVGLWAFQVLRLDSVPSPSAGAGAVIAQSAADAAIAVTAGAEGVNLLCRSLSTTLAEFQCATHCWCQIVAR